MCDEASVSLNAQLDCTQQGCTGSHMHQLTSCHTCFMTPGPARLARHLPRTKSFAYCRSSTMACGQQGVCCSEYACG